MAQTCAIGEEDSVHAGNRCGFGGSIGHAVACDQHSDIPKGGCGADGFGRGVHRQITAGKFCNKKD